jgi:formate-dependent nitrite reductase cytochrome c552 subunit
MKGNSMHHHDVSLDPFATIRGTCPVDYAIDDALIEFHFGSARHGIHITFDADALRNLMTLGNEALDKQTRLAEHAANAG